MKKSEKIKLRRGKSKAFVFANLIRPNVFPCAEKLVEILVKNRIETYMDPGAKTFLSVPEIIYSEPDKVLPEVDMVFIVGGDGTIIHAAKHAAAADKPLIGVNVGRLGFAADLEVEDIGALKRLLSGTERKFSFRRKTSDPEDKK